MNELKSEDVMPEGAVIDALVLRAPHDAVCRHALAILREKDAEIERLTAQIERCDSCDRIGLTHSEYIVCIKQARSEAITEFADRIIRFYNALPGKTVGGSVEYHVKQVRDAMLKEAEK